MNRKFDNQRNCRDCNDKSPLFKLLSEDELKTLDAGKTTVYYKKGETIRKQGAVLTHVISLSSGYAKVYLESPNNKNIILSVLSPSSFVGGPGMFVDNKNHFTVTSLTDTCVCFISQDTFKELLNKNKVFSDAYLRHLSSLTLSVFNRLINLTQKQMAGRLADSLIYLADEVFQSKNFDLTISRTDLADLCGMSRDNVVRNLKKFNKEKIIIYTGSNIKLIDYSLLTKISQSI